MRMLKTAAISFAALSMVAAPVAATAQDSARAVSADSQSELEGNSSWIIGLVGLLVGVGVIILVADKDDDSPVSP